MEFCGGLCLAIIFFAIPGFVFKALLSLLKTSGLPLIVPALFMAAVGAAIGNYRVFRNVGRAETGKAISIAMIVISFLVMVIYGITRSADYTQATGMMTATPTTQIQATSTRPQTTSTPTAIKVSPTSTRLPIIVFTTPLAATPIPVSTGSAPLDIDFFIDSVQVEADTIRLNVTIRRRSGNALDWYSDENRKTEIYLEDKSRRYELVKMGGIFTKDARLQPQQSYTGWLVFKKPSANSFVFHYPDVKPVQINLSR